MGNLAAAGLLAGIGQGAVLEGEQMNKEKMAHLDLQRELTIAQLRQQFEQEQQGRQQNFEGQQNDLNRAQSADIHREEMASADTRTDKDIAARHEDVATEGANAMERTKAVTASEVERARILAQAREQKPSPQDRWDFNAKSINNVYDKKGQLVSSVLEDAIGDRTTGMKWVQRGTIFVPANSDPASIRRPGAIDPRTGRPITTAGTQAAINDLVAGRVSDSDFTAKFGYLPAEYFKSLSPTFNRNQVPTPKPTGNGGTGLPAPNTTQNAPTSPVWNNTPVPGGQPSDWQDSQASNPSGDMSPMEQQLALSPSAARE